MKIRGIEIEKLLLDGKLFWKIKLKKAFFKNGKWWFGLNDKLLEEARKNNVEKLIIEIGNETRYLTPPTEKELKEKEKREEFEIRRSKFEGYPDWKIYHFSL